MPSENAPAPLTGSAADRRTLTALGVGMLVGATVIGIFVMLRAPEAPPGPPPPVVRPTPSVITSVRDLARLEAATAHVERIIELTDNQERLFGLVHGEDRILLVAAADVTAGVDLSALGEDAITTDEASGEVTVTLPRATVLTTTVDEAHTYVHARTTDVTATRREDLETLARREASDSLRNAALEGGILDRADASARRTVEALVRSMGHERVTVRTAAE